MLVIYVNGACVGVATTFETALTAFKTAYIAEYEDALGIEGVGYSAIINCYTLKRKYKESENEIYDIYIANNEDCWIERVPLIK